MLSEDLVGFCSYTTPLNYTGFSSMSSQQESSELWVLPMGVPAQPHPSLPLCQCSSPWDGSSELLGEPCAVLVP